jgi:hypothetical protein
MTIGHVHVIILWVIQYFIGIPAHPYTTCYGVGGTVYYQYCVVAGNY